MREPHATRAQNIAMAQPMSHHPKAMEQIDPATQHAHEHVQYHHMQLAAGAHTEIASANRTAEEPMPRGQRMHAEKQFSRASSSKHNGNFVQTGQSDETQWRDGELLQQFADSREDLLRS